MTDLTRLKVSLTKHGAHKIAWLLHQFDKDDVLDNLEGSVDGVNIEHAQASTNLSVAPSGAVPSVWNDAQTMGEDVVNGLVLLSIIFSHHRLIRAMIDSSAGVAYRGRIERDVQLPGKEYTNFAHILDEFGCATSHNSRGVSYDLSSIVKIAGLNELTQKILHIKLDAANWSRENALVDECIRLDFHKVLSMPEQDFRNWLVNGDTANSDPPLEELDDKEFFLGNVDEGEGGEFVFSPGHNEKKEGVVSVKPFARRTSSKLLHNEIQNNLYEYLAQNYGEENVSTENGTGADTSVDVVLKRDDGHVFYEIKTAKTVKQCIRQALPQLMEYAYWPDRNSAYRLVIVSHVPTNPVAEKYLATLRDRFSIPIFYEQFCLRNMSLFSAIS